MMTLARLRPVAAMALASSATLAASCEKKKEDKAPAPPKSLSELTTTLSTRHRHVFLSGHIDDELAKQVVAQLLFLDQEAPGEPINLHINSSGGKVYAGLAIHGVMRAVRSPVHTTCLGHCEYAQQGSNYLLAPRTQLIYEFAPRSRSMAAVLLAAGEPGERCALPHARVMIHQPTRTGNSKANAKQLATQAAETDRSRRKLAELLSADTGRPLAEMEAMMEEDHYMSAAQALELRVIDVVGECGHFARTKPVDAAKASDGKPVAPADTPAATAGAPDSPGPE